MLAGDEGQQVEAKNRGVPWAAGETAKALGKSVQSVSASLSSLEKLRLIWCLAEGTGKGRRVSHVKLSAEAVEVARVQIEYGMSADQLRRKDSHMLMTDLKDSLEAGRMPDWVQECIQKDMPRRWEQIQPDESS